MNDAAAPMRRPGLGRATLFNFAGFAVPVLLQLVTVPLFIRVIGIERYGVMALVWLLLGYFGLFDLGFGQAMARRIAILREAPAVQRAQVFWTGTCLSVLTGAAGGLLLYAAGTWLFGHVLSVPPGLRGEFRACLPLVAMALPIVTFISALSGSLQGREAFGPLNLSQVTGGVLYQVLPLLAASLVSPSLPGLVLAAIAGRLVTAGMLFWFCRARVPALSRPGLTAAEIPALLTYGGWLTLTGVISPLLTVFDRFVIGAVSGMGAVAAYTIPFNLVMRLAALPGSLQGALFPRFAAAAPAEAGRLQGRAVLIVAGVTTPMLVTALFAMQPFLRLWVGPGLAGAAAPVGLILIPGLWANILAFIPYGFLQSRNRPDVPAKFHAAELIFYAPLLFILTRHFGAAGAAAAWDIRSAADAVLLFAASRLMPGLLSCSFGLGLVLAAFFWVSAGVQSPLLYWSAGGGLLGVSGVWSVMILPRDVTQAAWLCAGRAFAPAVPS
jgi:O-antigen/teichoic acid export membrane protein